MAIRHKRTDIDHAAIRRAFNNPRTDAVFYVTLTKIKAHAVAIFVSRVKHAQPVTPPPYVTSFKIRRIRSKLGSIWRLENTDPAAFWVEFGAYEAHPTHPRILKYRPLGLAADIVASGG